jgi:hypothetical protein
MGCTGAHGGTALEHLISALRGGQVDVGICRCSFDAEGAVPVALFAGCLAYTAGVGMLASGFAQ